jgi:hypothetical protein
MGYKEFALSTDKCLFSGVSSFVNLINPVLQFSISFLPIRLVFPLVLTMPEISSGIGGAR